MKQTLILIDDEQEILDIFGMMLEDDFNVKLFLNWNELNVSDLLPTDIIVTDSHGVGEVKQVPCRVLVASGDESKNPDLQKPYSADDLVEYIKNLK